MRSPPFISLGSCALPLFIGCAQSPTDATFSVHVTLSGTPDVGGCHIAWHARASDPGVLVHYEIGAPASPDSINWFLVGTFRDSVTVQWDRRGAVGDEPVYWQLDAGLSHVIDSQRFSC